MSSNLMRLGLLAGSGSLLAGAIALAQERKEIEPSSRGALAVFNSLEGRGVVIKSVSDGARVEKGDVICELDGSELRDRLATQDIVVRGAEADVQGARSARDVAAIAVIEYQEGTFVQDLANSESEIKLAESELSRAVDRLDWTRRMFEKGYVTLSEKVSEELALKRCRFALEWALGKKKLLIDHSRPKMVKALTGAIETARAHELAKEAALKRERSAQKKLTDQIGRCKVAAPVAGRVEYVGPIGPGAVVQDGQLLLRLIPDGAAKPKAN
jgi:multidrug resistance efflux pump